MKSNLNTNNAEHQKFTIEEVKKLSDVELADKYRKHKKETGYIEPYLFSEMVERRLI